MRAALGLLALVLCAVATRADLPRWQSDAALWSSAVVVGDTPRAAINMARLAMLRGDVELALWLDAQALGRSARHPDDVVLVERLVRQQIQWIQSFQPTVTLCARPAWASWCPSS